LVPALIILLALSQEPAARDRTEAAALSTFARLPPAEQADLIEYFRAEAAHLPTFQASLVGFVIGGQDRDPQVWPEEGPAAWFDAREHTPENEIARRPLEADVPAVRAMAEKLRAKRGEAAFASAWRYDYATRGLLRSKVWKDPGRIFRNGLRGVHPDLDLVEALVERALDDGAERKGLTAFAHAYTDRDGGVYPRITLYDAWGSGLEIETPDVDTLGIIHTVLDDWKSWKAPVPASEHERLFDKVGEIFLAAQRHRELRRALAATYAVGSASVDASFANYVDNLHALWESCKSTPAELLPRLPNSEKRADFLASWTRTCKTKRDLWNAALERHRTLDADAETLRALLLRLLGEFTPQAGGQGRQGLDAGPTGPR